MIDDTGAVKERYEYDPYGNTTVLSPTYTARSTSDFDWETTYCGYRWDHGVSLFAVRHRYYSPLLGTWLSRDPIRYASDWNLLAYSQCRPIKVSDPMGLGPPPVSNDGEPVRVENCRVTVYVGHNLEAYNLLVDDYGTVQARGGTLVNDSSLYYPRILEGWNNNPVAAPPPIGHWIAFVSCGLDEKCTTDEIESSWPEHAIPNALRHLWTTEPIGDNPKGSLMSTDYLRVTQHQVAMAKAAAGKICKGEVPNPFPVSAPSGFARTSAVPICTQVTVKVKCSATIQKTCKTGLFYYETADGKEATDNILPTAPGRKKLQDLCDTEIVYQCNRM